jgi:hypothetical protein
MNTCITHEPLNSAIVAAALDSCQHLVDQTPEAKELYAKHREMCALLVGAVDKETANTIEDLVFNAANLYAAEMFQLGLAIGRDPSRLLLLPDAVTHS